MKDLTEWTRRWSHCYGESRTVRQVSHGGSVRASIRPVEEVGGIDAA